MQKSKKMSSIQQLVFRLETLIEIFLKSKFINARLAFLLRRINMEAIKKLLDFI